MAHSLGQVLDLLLGDRFTLVFAHAPDRLHHSDKVLLARQAHRQVRVVVYPLLQGDDPIVVTLRTIETVEELLENFFPGQFTVNEVLILAHVVDLLTVN